MGTSKKKKRTPQGRPAAWIWMLVIAGLVILAIAGVALARRGSPAAQGLPEEISIGDAFQKREAGAFILDVREPEEWQDVHIPGASHIPLGQLQARTGELPKDQEIVVVCRSGNRSATGRDILKEAGFTQVTSMAGGMNGWQEVGYPTASGE